MERKSDSTVKQGYSQQPERNFRLGSNCRLPIKEVLSGDVLKKQEFALKLFSEFIKSSGVNPDSNAAWNLFLHHLKDTKQFKNLRIIMNLHALVYNNLKKVDEVMMDESVRVRFEPIEKFENDEAENGGKADPVVIANFREEKNSLMRLIGQRVPGAIRLVELTRAKPKFEREQDMIDVHPYKYSLIHDNLILEKGSFFIFIHGVYEEEEERMKKILEKTYACGVYTVEKEGSYVGDNYEFNAIKKNDYSFIINGTFMGHGMSKGTFYTMAWWKKQKFDLIHFPTSKSMLIRNHYVVVKRRMRGIKASYAHEEPREVMISNTLQDGGKKSKVKLDRWEIKEDKIPNFLARAHSTSFYQTTKADGLSFSLRVTTRNEFVLVDRRGLVSSLEAVGVGVFKNHGIKNYDLLVEFIPLVGTPNKGLLYLSEVYQGGDPSLPFMEELESVRTEINKMVGMTLLGRKNYVLFDGKLLPYTPALPSDGAIYVPIYSNSRAYQETRRSSQVIVKPFPSTDTNIATLLLRKSTFNILYRLEGSTLTVDNPFSKIVQDQMKKGLMKQNDLYEESLINPLLYEGHSYPRGLFDESWGVDATRPTFVVTHVRVDKSKYDSDINFPLDREPLLNKGILGFTNFGGSLQGAARKFLYNLADSRHLCVMPMNVGVADTSLVLFMQNWLENEEPGWSELRNSLDAGCYEGTVENLICLMSKVYPPRMVLFLIDTLMRFDFVKRKYKIIRKNVVDVLVKFPVGADYRDRYKLTEVCLVDLCDHKTSMLDE